ncbi:MAG: hypothetical protein V2A76_12470 [Planctomycetota bacterium]
MRFKPCAILVLAMTAALAPARGQVHPIPIKGPIRHVQVGDGVPAKSAPRVIYSNTTTVASWWYIPLWSDAELIDWGTITASEDHDVVTDLAFGYGTSGPAAAFRYRVYDQYTGWCGTLGSTIYDVSLTGLPGHTSTTGGTGWIVSIDLKATGACFYLDEGPFGYSYSFAGDSQTGPLLATGGTGNPLEMDSIDHSSGTCGTWYGGIDYSWWTELLAHDGNDTFPGGCGGGLALQIVGPTCSGSTISIEVSGASVNDWWALALGTNIGSGLGGTVGGCPIDVAPVVPILIMGKLPSQPLSFPVTVNLISGVSLGMQAITKDPASHAFDTSNTEIIHVP